MAVYDRWHKAPADGDKPCKCGRGKNLLYPGGEHKRGDRWQVRWRDPATEKQRAKNFALRDGEDANKHADAFDKLIAGQILTRTYVDPKSGEITLRDYAETLRKTRTHGDSAARGLESRLRNHVYEGEPGSGRTPKGGAAIGQHSMGLLASRPTMIAAWAAAIPLAQGSARKAVDAVSAVFRAGIEDGIVGRDPTKASVVDRPGRGGRRAEPLAAAEVDAIGAEMTSRYQVIPRLGAGTGMREMEMCGLGADDVHASGRRPRIRVMRQLKDVGGVLHFGPVKNRKPHSVPLAPSLAALLSRHMELYPPVAVTLPWHDPKDRELHGKLVTVRLVLTRPDATAVTRGTIDAAWRRGVARTRARTVPGGRLRRSLARGTGIHRLRHTYASAQLRAGVDVVRVAAWMGDTPQMVLSTYAHFMPGETGDEGRAAIEAYFAGPGPASSALNVHSETDG